LLHLSPKAFMDKWRK